MRERSERVESPVTYAMRFPRPFLLGPVFFRTALPCSDGNHLERRVIPLHDAVGINCKKKARPLKIKAKCQVYAWAKGRMFDDCVCVI